MPPTLVVERKSYEVLHEWKSDTDNRIVSGYAATWDKDSVNDQIVPGAFTDTIQVNFHDAIMRKGSPDIRVLWEHQSPPIGVLRQIKEDDHGLWVEFYCCKTIEGERTLVLLQEKAVDRMSIGFVALKKDSSAGIRFLRSIMLLEFSVVTWPANTEALVMGIKRKIWAAPNGLWLPEMSKKGGKVVMPINNEAWGQYLSKTQEDVMALGVEVKLGGALSPLNLQRMGAVISGLTEVMMSTAMISAGEIAQTQEIGHRDMGSFPGNLLENSDRERPFQTITDPGPAAAQGTASNNREMPLGSPPIPGKPGTKSDPEPGKGASPPVDSPAYCSKCGSKLVKGACTKCEAMDGGASPTEDPDPVRRENLANFNKAMDGFGEGCPSPDSEEDTSEFSPDVADILARIGALTNGK